MDVGVGALTDLYERIVHNKRLLRLERSRERYLKSIIEPSVHEAFVHRTVSVIILPKSFAGWKFKLRRVK